jgi:hypothetical protein
MRFVGPLISTCTSGIVAPRMSVTVIAMPARPDGCAARRGVAGAACPDCAGGVVGFAVGAGVDGFAVDGGVDGFAVEGGVCAGFAGAGAWAAWANVAAEPAKTKLISKSCVRIPAI